MNINTVEDLQMFLLQIIAQLEQYNSIDVKDLKIICFIQSNDDQNNIEIKTNLNKIFSLIQEDTNIYNNELIITNPNIIFEGFLNNNLK